MRIGALLLVVWLVIGAAAAVQRDYFSGSSVNCAKAGTIAVTVLAGPLNYLTKAVRSRAERLPQLS